jgi:ribosomal protein S18 acetylase RimI-like enzyme
MKYSQEDGFLCLVAERVPPLRSLFSLGGAAAARSGKKSNSELDDDDDDDLSALDEFSTSSSSSSDSSVPSIAGVVEVSLQGEKRELEALWGVTGLMSGGNSDDNSSSSSEKGDESDGASKGGSEPNNDNLIRGLFAGWNSSTLPSPLAAESTGGFDESYAYVACMAVDERCRRSGAASALLAAAERAAGRWRQNWVLLHVHERNAGARALYASAGYAPLGPAERPGIVGAPRVLMGKQSGFPSSSSSSSSESAGGGIMSIPSDLLGALKRDSEERAAKAKAKREKEERG